MEWFELADSLLRSSIGYGLLALAMCALFGWFSLPACIAATGILCSTGGLPWLSQRRTTSADKVDQSAEKPKRGS
jgi:hypothetical protein